ncbi:MAG: hypothetical protein GY866_26925 [Proteobacteria bacterium]|nr:hypothetical protein [Pseudomonadota bacterium]
MSKETKENQPEEQPEKKSETSLKERKKALIDGVKADLKKKSTEKISVKQFLKFKEDELKVKGEDISVRELLIAFQAVVPKADTAGNYQNVWESTFQRKPAKD